MANYGDIRTRFEMALNEKFEMNRNWFSNTYKAYTQQIAYPHREIKQKSGESLRADLGMEPDQMLGKMLVDAGIEPDSFEIDVIQPGDTGSKSGSYLTLILTFLKPQTIPGANFETNNAYSIVNATQIRGGEKAVVNKKDTTPEKVGVSQNQYTSTQALVADCEKFINAQSWPDNYKTYLSTLVAEITNQTQHRPQDTIEQVIEANSYQIKLSTNLVQEYDIDPISVNNIGNDFGEILGGLFLLNMVKTPGSGITYPQGSNAALVDFYFDGWSISSKAGKRGGVPSIRSMVKVIMDNHAQGTLQLEGREIELLDTVIRVINDPIQYHKDPNTNRQSQVFSTYIALANKHLTQSNTGYQYFLNQLNLDATTLSRSTLIDTIIELYTQQPKQLAQILQTYFKMTGSTPKGYNTAPSALKQLAKNLKAQKLDAILGAFFYPLTVELVNELNVKYQTQLSQLVNKVSNVQQLYLITNPKQGTVEFKFKSFSRAQFKFMAGASAPNPLNKNIALLSL